MKYLHLLDPDLYLPAVSDEVTILIETELAPRKKETN
jgi:hypothetical protein